MSALLELQECAAVGGSVAGLQALSSPVLPPVRLGLSDPGSGYVAVPSGVPVWLPAELESSAVSTEVSGGASAGAVLSLASLSAGRGAGTGEESLRDHYGDLTDPDDGLAPRSGQMPRGWSRE